MKMLFATLGLLLLSICSVVVVLASILSYESGYGLVIENHNATALDLYFATGDGSPATAFTQFHQQMREFPKVSIGANSILSTNFESSGEPPRGLLLATAPNYVIGDSKRRQVAASPSQKSRDCPKHLLPQSQRSAAIGIFEEF